jgi:hypothetical protein
VFPWYQVSFPLRDCVRIEPRGINHHARRIQVLSDAGKSIGSIVLPGLVRNLDARQEFFANDFAVLDSVNADFGHFPTLFGFLIRHIGVVLHNKPIVRDERSLRIESVHLHRVDPPIDFAADTWLAARFR